MKVPFLDIVSQDKPLKADIQKVFDQAVSSAGFIGGPNVTGFETEFASFCKTDYCVAVGSGTDALRFALMAAAGLLPVMLVLGSIILWRAGTVSPGEIAAVGAISMRIRSCES